MFIEPFEPLFNFNGVLKEINKYMYNDLDIDYNFNDEYTANHEIKDSILFPRSSTPIPLYMEEFNEQYGDHSDIKYNDFRKGLRKLLKRAKVRGVKEAPKHVITGHLIKTSSKLPDFEDAFTNRPFKNALPTKIMKPSYTPPLPYDIQPTIIHNEQKNHCTRPASSTNTNSNHNNFDQLLLKYNLSKNHDRTENSKNKYLSNHYDFPIYFLPPIEKNYCNPLSDNYIPIPLKPSYSSNNIQNETTMLCGKNHAT